MYEWNKPFQLVMEIKHEYEVKFNDGCIVFDLWVERLDVEKYNKFAEPLQINQKGDMILIRYGLAEMQRGMWEDKDSIYRQCRSLVIDLRNEHIVASPFRKFFNLNEVEENNIDLIKEEIANAKLVEITDKLDGSMQSCRYYNGKIWMFGSMALDKEGSWRLEDGYSMLSDGHKNMIQDNQNFTFVFEYISTEDAHVVIYNKEDEGLYLIGVIDVLTGNELSYSEVIAMANKYKIRSTSAESYTFDDIIELAKTAKSNEKEGWVINIDGHKVKLKCDDYVSLHRILDHVSSDNVIIKAIADGNYDDLISKIPESHRNRIKETSDYVFDFIQFMVVLIHEVYNECYSDEKKDFMVNVNQKCPKELQGYVREKYLNGKFNLLKTQNGSYKKMREIREVLEKCKSWL
jgi:T4 RnlA family RNA ligase